MMPKQLYYILAGIIGIIIVIGGIWFLFFRSSSPSGSTITGSFFGTANNTSTVGVTNTGTSNNNGNQPITSSQAATQKIFLIAQGPVAGATLIQTLHPTTTLARYINQEDGHVYDLAVDVPGAMPRVVSNVTIPGAERVLWLEQGSAALLQYLDGQTVKSVYFGLPVATTSTKIVPTRIQFLPDNIVDIAASPDGKSVAYMLKTQSGSDGYVAKSDGTSAKKIFSLPLSQVLVSWPAQSTLLVQSKSAAGVPGIAFSVDIKSGAVASLVSAQGLTAMADSTFSQIIYQTTRVGDIAPTTYIHTIKNNTDTSFLFNVYLQKCLWWGASTMYCAAPLGTMGTNYQDLWNQGVASAADSILKFTGGITTVITTPSSNNGGVQSDILEMALSPDEHYLSFTTKGARSLWGVRLTQ